MSLAGHDHAHHRVGATSRLFRLRIRLSSAMWLPVLGANVVAVALAIGLTVLDEHIEDQRALPITTSAAQTIFGALAGGMITFTGIVFSAVFVAAQIQTSSYSPRLAARLRRDPVVIAGLAFPTASASYALVALAAIGRQTNGSGDFVPAVTVLFGLVLAAVTLPAGAGHGVRAVPGRPDPGVHGRQDRGRVERPLTRRASRRHVAGAGATGSISAARACAARQRSIREARQRRTAQTSPTAARTASMPS